MKQTIKNLINKIKTRRQYINLSNKKATVLLSAINVKKENGLVML